MDDNEQKLPPKQVCTMRIIFPVESDEQAIALKKKINEALSDLPEAGIDFALSNMTRHNARST